MSEGEGEGESKSTSIVSTDDDEDGDDGSPSSASFTRQSTQTAPSWQSKKQHEKMAVSDGRGRGGINRAHSESDLLSRLHRAEELGKMSPENDATPCTILKTPLNTPTTRINRCAS